MGGLKKAGESGRLPKTVTRFGRYADLAQASIALWHLIMEDFSGLSFQDETAGKLRLNQNDGNPVPLAQIPDTLAGKNAEIIVQKEGTKIGQRRKINFIAGAGISIDIVDDPANNRINITISTTG